MTRVKNFTLFFLLCLSYKILASEQRAPIERMMADQKLWNTCESGKKQELKKAILRGANVNDEDHCGETALMKAVQQEKTEFVRFLLKLGAHVDSENIKGETALHYVARNGNKVILKLLLNGQENLNAKTSKSGISALHQAVISGHSKVVKKLLKQSGLEINARDDEGKTALLMAIEREHIETVSLLLKAKADTSIKDFMFELTAFHYATMMENEKITELLIKSGLTVNLANEDDLKATRWVIHNKNKKLADLCYRINLKNNGSN